MQIFNCHSFYIPVYRYTFFLRPAYRSNPWTDVDAVMSRIKIRRIVQGSNVWVLKTFRRCFAPKSQNLTQKWTYKWGSGTVCHIGHFLGQLKTISPLLSEKRHTLCPTINTGKSSESVQLTVLKACDACADMGQL